VECGGNRRQKAVSGGIYAKNVSPKVVKVTNGRWNVMAIHRGKGEIYLGGTMPAFAGPPPFGWLQKLDPVSLKVLAESPELPCGEHVWCGAIAAHGNGNIIMVNGNYIHSLSRGCEIIREARLPVDQAHNGLLVLSDGTIVTKDLRLENQGRSTITRVDPENLELVHKPFVLPVGSMGRIASDKTSEGEFIYVPGIEKVWRIKVADKKLELDKSWSSSYREIYGDQGLAWDGCISDGYLWLMDNGDIDSLRAIYGVHPNGRFTKPDKVAFSRLSWQRPTPWKGSQRLLRFSLSDGSVETISPFVSSGGGIIAPPVNVPEHNICLAWDSINGGLVGISTENKELKLAWTLDVRPSMQPVVFPDSGELVINNYEKGDDQLIVVDIVTGELLSQVSLGSPVANGMFLSPGFDRDIYYCSTLTIARVKWG
jgi:hypothetical protein